MPSFPTPKPVAVTVELVGDLHITASDRDDTRVTVRPADPSSTADVKAAEQTTVELVDGRLTIRAPRNWRRYTPFGGTEAIEVSLELPSGSQVTADSALGSMSAQGELGACRLKTAMGNIRVDHAGPLVATTGFGTITVDRITGDADLSTGAGAIRVEAIRGSATVKNSNGDTTVGEVTGDLRAKAANGDIVVRRAHSSVTGRTANGDVRFLDVRQGTFVLATSAGELEIGVRSGTAAWFDAVTKFGAVRCALDTTDEPTPGGPRAEVHARTSVGDVIIGPAPPAGDVELVTPALPTGDADPSTDAPLVDRRSGA